jgi:hypothetical protein
MNATEEETPETLDPVEDQDNPQVDLQVDLAPAPIRPLALAKSDLEKQLALFKAFVTELERTRGRLARAELEEGEILEGEASSEEEQLEKLSRTLALKKVLERKLERGDSIGYQSTSAQLGAAVKEALRSLWQELAALRAKREEKHLGTLKKLVGEEEHWPWALERAKTLMRHFGDLRAIDRLGESADYSLSHGAPELAAEQVLSDIGILEAETGGGRTKR